MNWATTFAAVLAIFWFTYTLTLVVSAFAEKFPSKLNPALAVGGAETVP
jgi:hypothetical protein